MRKIFIGSSTEALDKAKSIGRVLSTIEDTKPVLFKEFFEPGFLTFEALEEMLIQCCGAVFVASADDDYVIRGRKTKCPRANVLLEFGLVAGRLGRHNVAVCQYDSAELPSDLKGLTIIEVGGNELIPHNLQKNTSTLITDPARESPGTQQGLESPANKHARERLRIWASRLVDTTETIERTGIVHGYTGRWDYKLRLDKWRDLPIEYPSYAQVNGAIDLFIPATGHGGRGFVRGSLFFKLQGQDPSDAFQGEFRTAHEITNAVCHKDGRVEFTSEVFTMQKMASAGVPPPQLLATDIFPEPWTAQWILCPSSEPRTLVGKFSTEGAGVSQGMVKATKVDASQ